MTDAQPHRFIHLNLLQNDPPHKLAVVSPETYLGQGRYCWRAKGARPMVKRQVSTLNWDAERSDHLVHYLGAVALGLERTADWYPLNGDWFDLRKENLVPGEPPANWVEVSAGSTLPALEGYAAALQYRYHHLPELRAGLKRGGVQGCLSPAQVLKLLEDARTLSYLKGQPLETFRLYILDEFNLRMTVSQIGLILAGNACRLPGYDYAALRATRPSPSQVAHFRWATLRAARGEL